jgi:hypothetical protein
LNQVTQVVKTSLDLADSLQIWQSPFDSARMLSRHFNACAITVKEILTRDPGLTKITRRLVPHTLSDRQKVKRVETPTELVWILNNLEDDSFDGITTGDESWFQYLYESSAMFVKWPYDVISRTKK